MSDTATEQCPAFYPTYDVEIGDTTLTGVVTHIHHAATDTGYTTITVETPNGSIGSERLRRGSMICLVARA